jgi:hypothetical protein
MGRATMANGPVRATSRYMIAEQIAGKSASVAIIAALTSTATHVCRPPYIVITWVTQYTVPVK